MMLNLKVFKWRLVDFKRSRFIRQAIMLLFSRSCDKQYNHKTTKQFHLLVLAKIAPYRGEF